MDAPVVLDASGVKAAQFYDERYVGSPPPNSSCAPASDSY